MAERRGRSGQLTMSDPHLPAEMLDHVVDHLYDAEEAFRSCCLVSKPWTPRTQKYLFADIAPPIADSLGLWKRRFQTLNLSCVLRQHYPLTPYCHGCRCRRAWLDQGLFSRRALGGGQRWIAGRRVILSRSIHWGWATTTDRPQLFTSVCLIQKPLSRGGPVTSLRQNPNVESTPPTRDPRPHSRPFTRQPKGTGELLSRLQIVGFTHSKAPFRPC
jgi:hypothetical protein